MDEFVIKLIIVIAAISLIYIIVSILGLAHKLYTDYAEKPEFRTEILTIAIVLIASSTGLFAFIVTTLIS